jgi:hypothetical protein
MATADTSNQEAVAHSVEARKPFIDFSPQRVAGWETAKLLKRRVA